MALSPIAFIAPNYRDFKTYWLKAYEPGETTPKAMALDSEGVTTVAKLELNADGFLESAGGALVIPYLNGAYDLFLFPTEAEADANNTTNAEKVADDILGVLPDDAIETLLINDLSQAYKFNTVSLMTTSLIEFPNGKLLKVTDTNTDYIKTSGSSPEPIGSPSLTGGGYAAINIVGVVDIRQFGGKNDNTTDNTPIIEAIESAGFKFVLIDRPDGSGQYKFDSVPTIPNITTLITTVSNVTGVTTADINGIVLNNGLSAHPSAPDLVGKNIEIIAGTLRQEQLIAIGSNPSNGITSSGTTATVTQIDHGYASGERVFVRDADQAEYNGTFLISNITTDTYDYTIAATTSPATGGIAVRNLARWDWIKDSNHEPIGVIDTQPAIGTVRELDIPFTKTYSRVLSIVCGPDEEFVKGLNMSVGASVGLDKMTLSISVDVSMSFTLEYLGASNWGTVFGNEQGGPDDFEPEIISVTHDNGTGVTTILHSALPGYDLSATQYTGGSAIGSAVPYMPVINGTDRTWLPDNDVYKTELKWIDQSTGAFSLPQNSPMAAMITKTFTGATYVDGQGGTADFDLDKGNIWFYGIMEV